MKGLDMSKKLIICNTVFQLYTAINLRVNHFHENDIVDLILTDRTDFREIPNRLEKEKLFSEIFHIKINDYYQKRIPFKIKIARYLINKFKIDMIFSKNIVRSLFYRELEEYDELYISNHDTFAELLFNHLIAKNEVLRVFEYEDGYGTYVRPLRNENDSKKKFKQVLYNFLNVDLLLPETLQASYIYEPMLYCWVDEVKKIKLSKFDIEKKYLIDQLNRIFDYSPKDTFNKKFILLEESFSADGIKNNDFELFAETIRLVNKSNIIIKTHPRNRINRFQDFEVKVFSEPIPWEIITMNEKFDDKVLITITSSTVFTPKILYDSNCTIILLYKLMTGYNSIFDSSNMEEFIIKAKNKYGSKMYIPKTLSDLKSILDEYS